LPGQNGGRNPAYHLAFLTNDYFHRLKSVGDKIYCFDEEQRRVIFSHLAHHAEDLLPLPPISS